MPASSATPGSDKTGPASRAVSAPSEAAAIRRIEGDHLMTVEQGAKAVLRDLFPSGGSTVNAVHSFNGHPGADGARGADGTPVGAPNSNPSTGADRLAGGKGTDVLIGGPVGAPNSNPSTGADRLAGGKGTDVLIGGPKSDVFAFTEVGKKLADSVPDFTLGEDMIELARSTFSRLGSTGPLDADVLFVGTAPEEPGHRLTYTLETGEMFNDPDGSGPKSALLITEMTRDLSLDAESFLTA